MSDQERQLDEMLVLESICEKTEFSFSKKDKYECQLHIIQDLNTELNVQYSYDQNALDQIIPFTVKNLPKVSLFIQLPDNYPSERPPNFKMVISWLPPWESSRVCQKLEEIWQENEGCEILYEWIEFLKHQLLSFLNIETRLDITFLFLYWNYPNSRYLKDLVDMSDKRAITRAGSIHPKYHLIETSKSVHNELFVKNFHCCIICYEDVRGDDCVEMKICGRVVCKDCLRQYIFHKVNDASGDFRCPGEKCYESLEPHVIKSVSSLEVYSTYEVLMLKVALSKMKDVVICPRKDCENAVIMNPGDNLVTCAYCQYSFCSVCRKGYHGISLCESISVDTAELLEKYKKANGKEKRLMLEKYGKHQMRRLEDMLTKVYITENSKKCPQCRTPTVKTEGCNKMTCSFCNAFFCYICGTHIKSRNPYDHFSSSEYEECRGRLWVKILDEPDPKLALGFYDEEFIPPDLQ